MSPKRHFEPYPAKHRGPGPALAALRVRSAVRPTFHNGVHRDLDQKQSDASRPVANQLGAQKGPRLSHRQRAMDRGDGYEGVAVLAFTTRLQPVGPILVGGGLQPGNPQRKAPGTTSARTGPSLEAGRQRRLGFLVM